MPAANRSLRWCRLRFPAHTGSPSAERDHCHQSRTATARGRDRRWTDAVWRQRRPSCLAGADTNPEVAAETHKNNQTYPLALVKGCEALLDVAVPDQPQVPGEQDANGGDSSVIDRAKCEGDPTAPKSDKAKALQKTNNSHVEVAKENGSGFDAYRQ